MDTTTGTPLRKAREAAGLSMEALARRANVATATVYRAENQRHRTSDATWRRLADALGVDVSVIRSGHDPEAASPDTR